MAKKKTPSMSVPAIRAAGPSRAFTGFSQVPLPGQGVPGAIADPFVELGHTGLVLSAGRVQDELLRQLIGIQAIRTFREMRDNDPVIGAMIYAIDMQIRRVTWRVKPFSGDLEDIQRAELIDGMRDDMSHSWAELLSEILSFLVFGWSYFEVVYKLRQGQQADPSRRSRYNDGLVGIRKIAIRTQESLYRWEPDEAGGIRGLWQSAFPTYWPTFMPIEKSLLFRTTSYKNSPEGRGVLRSAYVPWYFKKRIQEFEAIGIERDLAGIPVALVPPNLLDPNASPSDKALLESIKTIVRNIKNDDQAGVVFPAVYDDHGHLLYELKLMSTGGKKQIDTNAVIERYDQRIAMTTLADVILIGHSARGSYALADQKAELFSSALTSFVDIIQQVLNRHLIPRLYDANDWPREQLCTLEHGDIESVNLKDLGDYVSKLAAAGAPLFPSQDGELERFLLRQGNMPDSGISVVPLGEEATAEPPGGPKPTEEVPTARETRVPETGGSGANRISSALRSIQPPAGEASQAQGDGPPLRDKLDRQKTLARGIAKAVWGQSARGLEFETIIERLAKEEGINFTPILNGAAA